MKKHITAIMATGILALVVMACNFTTANVSDMTFGKTKDADSSTTTFKTGDDIFAIVTAANMPSGKYKMTWTVTYDNVAGHTKGENFGGKPMDFEGSAKLWTQFSAKEAGDYKVEAVLTDDTGKTTDTKSGIVKVTE